MQTKGIILAGGKGTRLHPMTGALSKQALPVYDKPMIYYPLSTLMLAGIRDILVISTPEALPTFQTMLGNGRRWGLTLSYAAQPRPEGIAQAFLIGERFIGSDPVALILGDNLFYGTELTHRLQSATRRIGASTIFGYRVSDPERYGIVTLDSFGKPLDIQEKPTDPQSPWAVPGLYFYTPDVVDVARRLKPSARGELEITDVNRHFLAEGRLEVELLGRGMVWLDCGTPEALLDASQFIRVIEQRAGQKVCCPEEIAFRAGFIDRRQLAALGQEFGGTSYGAYLLGLLDEI